MRTWEGRDPDLGRPIAAPLEQCAELLGVDLATVREMAVNVEPYVRADGTRIWSLMQLERQLRPRRSAGGGATTSTVDAFGCRNLVCWRPERQRRPGRAGKESQPLRYAQVEQGRTLTASSTEQGEPNYGHQISICCPHIKATTWI